MQYKDAAHYKSCLKNRQAFSRENDYEVFSWSICLNCKYFKADPDLPIAGDCQLMSDSGCYDGVMALAVCNRFIDRRGYDLNGKVVNPELLPKWIATTKKSDGLYVA